MTVSATRSEARIDDDVGEAERPKEPALDAAEEEERQEDDDDDERRVHDRGPDLARGVVDHPQRRPPLGLGQVVVLPEPPEDVLDVDDGVVDQLADRDRHAAQRHRVDRDAEQLHGEDRDDERERDRDERDRRRAEVPEEEEQDDDDEDRAVAQRLDDVVDRRP